MANETTTSKMVIRDYKDIPDAWLPRDEKNRYRGKGFVQIDVHAEMYRLAIKAGVEDRSYNTVSRGAVCSYRGEAEIEFQGKKFRAIGSSSTGTPEYLASQGSIIFVEQ